MYYKKSQVHQMLAQVLDYSGRHPELVKGNPAAAELVPRLQSSYDVMSDFATSHYSKTGAVLDNGGIRLKARTAVQDQMFPIYQTVRAMGLQGCWLPLSQSDKALLEAGNGFIKDAEPIQAELIVHGLPPDFLEKLKETVGELEKTVLHVGNTRSDRTEAMKGFDEAMKQAKADLKLFKAVMANLLRKDPIKKVGWDLARRVNQTGGKRGPRKTAAPKTAKSSDPPIVASDAVSTQNS